MEKPLVSVFCLTYNHESMIEDALKGFVMQKTNFPFEVFVHDDASTDGTVRIIKQYAEAYPQIIRPVLQTENQYSKHVKITNTYLVPRATGKYFAFCEGDDFWTDEYKLQRQVDFLEQHPEYVACVHNSIQINCKDHTESIMFPRTEDGDVSFEDTLYAWPRTYQTSSLVVRREYRDCEMPSFYNAVKGFADWPFSIWLALNGKIRFLAECMSTYRYCSCAHSFMAQRTQNTVDLIQRSIEMLKAIRPYVEGGVYEDTLETAILKKEYQLLNYRHEYKEMRRAPYASIYRQESLKTKLKLYIKQFCPKAVARYKGKHNHEA